MRLCLFGAASDTANLGVSALMMSAVAAIARAAPDADVTVFDNGWGVREGSIRVGESRFPIRHCGARYSRRFHRPESLWNMRMAAWLGWKGNPGTRLMDLADAVLDLSGGDSFADLYGPKRFRAITLPKQIALELGRPLVLLPQTYGPFHRRSSRRAASAILDRSTMAWARCGQSFLEMKELLGRGFDPARHRSGIDVAMGLEALRPQQPLGPRLEDWLVQSPRPPVVGFNVSGLVYNDPQASARYGLRADYRAVVHGFLSRLLAETDSRILFVPHVNAPEGSVESDGAAVRGVTLALPAGVRERTAIAPGDLGPCEAKWLISRMHWFCGTRMHSTIAGLSSGVPTAAIAYSLKTRGVFETCDQGVHVADARTATTGELVELLWKSWEAREASRARLRQLLPDILARTQQQMETILRVVRGSRDPMRVEETV